MYRKRTRKKSERRGAVAVEFALVAPVFVVVLVGYTQAGSLFDVQGNLKNAAREGARLASMDRDGLLQEGQTTNQKIEADIRNYLKLNGLPYNEDDVDIYISEVDNHETVFDLDDPDNNLRYFQVKIDLPYENMGSGGMSFPGIEGFGFGAKVVFRNSRAALVQ